MSDNTSSPAAPIEFIDLGAQRRRIGARMDEAILRVVNHGKYIMGPEVGELERKLAAFCGVKHCIGVANGTDALAMALMAKGVKVGDAVLVPAFTFAATAEPVVLLGATPIFVDVLEDTFNMDPVGLEAGIVTAKRLGLKPVAAIAVDLFGQPADYDAIEPILKKHGLWLLADAAQSFGAAYRGRNVGGIGDIATTSFFPAKPLGCYGDGGAVFTNDDAIAATVRSLRMHGQGTDKYDNARIGVNSRLDTIQAAVLLLKLEILPDEIAARDRVARRYAEALSDVTLVPNLIEGATSVWAQYTLRLPEHDRDAVAAKLKAWAIPTAVYYSRSLHRQPAYRDFPVAGNGLPVSERLARQVLSLPMHAYLDDQTTHRIVVGIRQALA
jgi:dTDP-4-amino-4,6-dideoxygalactose transaminase